MDYQLDVSKEYITARKGLFLLSLLFTLLLSAVLIADVLLVTLAGEDYLVNLIIAIVISILFIWFAIFFFSNIYSEANNKYRYFRSYEEGLKPEEEVEFLKKSDEFCYVNGLYVYPLFVRYAIGLNRQDKVIYTVSKDLDYKMGDKLTITTYQRILIKAERHS